MIAGVDAAKRHVDTIARKTKKDALAEQAGNQSTEREDAPSAEQEGDQSAPANVKYILDSGYSSRKNLAALTNKDVYMPDK